jgi:hypothetical protein
MRRAAMVAAFALATLGCGGGTKTTPEPDAAVPAAPTREAREVLSGAGRVSGGTLVMDVQIGPPIGQGSVASGATVVEGDAPIKP